MVRGKHCEYKAMLKKTDIEPMVIEAIREIVRNEEYAQAIKKRIGVQIDTKAVDKELEGYQATVSYTHLITLWYFKKKSPHVKIGRIRIDGELLPQVLSVDVYKRH